MTQSPNKTPTTRERRKFTRVAFLSPAVLIVDGRERSVSILDLCFKGALVKLDAVADAPEVGSHCELSVRLSPEAFINMHVQVAHAHQELVGVRCEHLDIESMQHLRRLVELNLGDPELLDRELTALTQL